MFKERSRSRLRPSNPLSLRTTGTSYRGCSFLPSERGSGDALGKDAGDVREETGTKSDNVLSVPKNAWIKIEVFEWTALERNLHPSFGI